MARLNLTRDALLAALAVSAVAATLVLGQIATYPNLSPWYEGLAKPSFNPPSWVFAPVWSTLYALMAFGLWRVLRMTAPSRMRRRAIVLFFILLGCNAAWPWMFFWAQSPLLGLINIVSQLTVIVAAIVVFARLDPVAAICLVPLVAWVAFASLLNAAIWRLNA
jgi:translocator protein